jgi:hypothetical protein
MPRNFCRRAFLRRIDQREALMQVEFEPGALNRRPTGRGGGSEKPERIMSDEFDGLDATEKAAIGVALNRCRAPRPKLRTNSVVRGPSTSLTNCRWQTFARPLSALPMSSAR